MTRSPILSPASSGVTRLPDVLHRATAPSDSNGKLRGMTPETTRGPELSTLSLSSSLRDCGAPDAVLPE